MSRNRVTDKAVSAKGKANNKPVAITMERRAVSRAAKLEDAIASAENSFEMLLLDGERQGADAIVGATDSHADRYKAVISLMKKSRDAEYSALADELQSALDSMKKLARSVRGVIEKAKSRAAELEGR